MTFEEYLQDIPALHTWDGGKTWNSGGFNADQLRVFNNLVARVGGHRAAVLETGAGNSTLCFLYAKPASLISIAPDADLFRRILTSCQTHGVDSSPLEYHVDRSEWLLPKLAEACRNGKPKIDLALIDGGHGWPTVFVDFCYVNIMVRKGGIIVIDDLQLHSIKELGRFLRKQESSFTQVEDIGKALAFRKDTDDQFLPEWNQEAYIVERTDAYARTGEPLKLFYEA